MAWLDSPFERRSIIRGMRVRDEGGELLGYVAHIGQEHLFVRRWPFSRRWSAAPLARVLRVGRGAVVLEGRGRGMLTPADKGLFGEIPTQTHPLAEPPGVGAVRA